MTGYSKHLLEILAVSLLYFAFAQIGFLFAIPGANITLLWLPSGLAMAGVVLLGNHAAAGVFAGAFLANYLAFGSGADDTPLQVALAVAAGNAAGSLLSGALFSRFITFNVLRLDVSQVLLFAGVAMFSTLPSALWGALQLTPGVAAPQDLGKATLIWWAGDTLGIIIGFPLLYFLYSKYFQGNAPATFVQQMSVLSIGVLLSATLYLFTMNLQRESLQLRFRYVAEVAFLSLEMAIEQIFQHQAQLADIVSSDVTPSREFFREQVESVLSGPYRTRGVFALSWNPVVLDEGREALESAARAQGYQNFSIRERDAQGALQVSSRKELYVVVAHIEPLASNMEALGYDIYSDPLRRATIDRALQLDEPVLTPPVALVQSQGQDASPGALLLWPVRSVELAPDAPHSGFVVAVIRYDDMLSQTTTSLISDAVVSIFDVTDPQAVQLVYANDPAAALSRPPGLSSERPFLVSEVVDVGRRQLQIFAEPRPEFLAQNQSFTPLIVLLVSLLLSVLATLVYSQRTRIAEARADMLNRTSQIINSAPDAMVAMNAQGAVTEWNQAAVDMFGYTEHEAVGRKLADLIVPEAWRSAHNHALEHRVPEAESKVINHTIEVQACRANGEQFPVELAVKSVTIKGVQEYIGLLRDLTEKKLFEEKKSEAQKMEAIGQMTGGLAHDFNNLLGIVIANLDYLDLQRLGPQDAVHARSALDAALRASKVTRSLMSVARRQTLEIRITDVNSQIVELAPLIETTAGKHVGLETRLFAQPLWASLDKSGFSNAIINLLINARDAVKGRSEKHIILSTDVEELGSNAMELAPGTYVVIAVRDNGSGIPESIRKRVMEPFFTTKERGHGTGLGLPMVYGFARQLDGTVLIESEEGVGTTVSIYLPLVVSHDLAVEPESRNTREPAHAGALTVLLVDDEAFLRRIAARMIADLGFRVLEAESGDQAQGILRTEAVDILFTDIAMPGQLDGVQLAVWTSANLPKVRIILATGYLDDQSRLTIDRHWQVLEKPYRRDDLSRALLAV
jgi:PAS domain S-box-containing protein